MERTKKMVLIFTDNLERLQQHCHISPTSVSSSLASSSTAILSVLTDNSATALNIASVENENTVRTPGSVLSCLGAEMHRILSSSVLGGAWEKWRLYREVLQLYFFRSGKSADYAEKKKRNPLLVVRSTIMKMLGKEEIPLAKMTNTLTETR
ncbi:hypothetical protein EAI_13740 [Harpegnathos saltator]|uniref:Uncharacterized protein n=1 Tax=Harpegnathos saltator TaxID=610380 RepID=E2C459_HARSA|nr:hypothetical protein EAI_13740 [Harpegnathos saltator]